MKKEVEKNDPSLEGACNLLKEMTRSNNSNVSRSEADAAFLQARKNQDFVSYLDIASNEKRERTKKAVKAEKETHEVLTNGVKSLVHLESVDDARQDLNEALQKAKMQIDENRKKLNQEPQQPSSTMEVTTAMAIFYCSPTNSFTSIFSGNLALKRCDRVLAEEH